MKPKKMAALAAPPESSEGFSIDASKLPAALAAVNEIKTLHAEIIGAARTTLAKAQRIGELLTDIKADLSHGQWLPWIADNLPFTERTARNYIRVYQKRAQLKSETVSDLSDAYTLLAEPKLKNPQLIDRDFDSAEDLALNITEAGQLRFAMKHAGDMAALSFLKQRLDEANTLPEVVAIKRECERLGCFWHTATLTAERELGRCLHELEVLGIQASNTEAGHE